MIAGYWPLGSEIDPRPLMQACAAAGALLALPETTLPGTPLIFRRYTPQIPMLRGRFNTHHPRAETITPDLLLVPLLAFTPQGHRLGQGGGYYDRTLAALPHAIAIGCAYAAQQRNALPTGPHDGRLHAIATEHGLIETRK